MRSSIIERLIGGAILVGGLTIIRDNFGVMALTAIGLVIIGIMIVQNGFKSLFFKKPDSKKDKQE